MHTHRPGMHKQRVRVEENMMSVSAWFKETFCKNPSWTRKTADGRYDLSSCPFVIMEFEEFTEEDMARIRKKIDELDNC